MMPMIYSIREDEVSNLCVDQKNAILRLVNNNEFERALAALDIVSGMWKRLDYEYKEHEIRSRIDREIREFREKAFDRRDS